jgi:hypothetical protein
VLASATGPVLLALCREQLRGSGPFFIGCGAVAAVLAVLAWCVRPPVAAGVRS